MTQRAEHAPVRLLAIVAPAGRNPRPGADRLTAGLTWHGIIGVGQMKSPCGAANAQGHGPGGVITQASQV